ncbi:MAG: hypothetical protein M0C28_33010, partial [Candidatus Moduliflexus flocculans]|nr:hypothetical protein [Candidatus Moduliflexus flocculans]
CYVLLRLNRRPQTESTAPRSFEPARTAWLWPGGPGGPGPARRISSRNRCRRTRRPRPGP